VVARFPDEDEELLAAYMSGSGVDSIGGAEAVISHLITQELGIPCAHAPAVPVGPIQADLVRSCPTASPALQPAPLCALSVCTSACTLRFAGLPCCLL
jgi:hypothetical protein